MIVVRPLPRVEGDLHATDGLSVTLDCSYSLLHYCRAETFEFRNIFLSSQCNTTLGIQCALYKSQQMAHAWQQPPRLLATSVETLPKASGLYCLTSKHLFEVSHPFDTLQMVNLLPINALSLQ